MKKAMSSTIGDALFTKTQQRVLGLLYGAPGKSFYTNEILRWADMGRGTIRRELERLVTAGLFVSSRTGNQLHFKANPDNPVYGELLGIVRKTFGIADMIGSAMLAIDDRIDYAFIYGSIAKGEENAKSDIDLFVVGDTLEYADLVSALAGAERSLGRPINPSIYTAGQVKEKLEQNNAFITRLMEQPKIWVKGNDEIIKEFGESGEDRRPEN